MPAKDFYFRFGENLKIIFYFWVKERGGRRKYPNLARNAMTTVMKNKFRIFISILSLC
jgi:hypothetical protein